jgi:hypothetical protein
MNTQQDHTTTEWGRPIPKCLDPDEREAYLDDAEESSPMDWPDDDDCPIRAAERRAGA